MGGCTVDPALTIREEEDGVRLLLYRGDEESNCAPIGYVFGVRLNFDTPIEDLDVRTEYVGVRLSV